MLAKTGPRAVHVPSFARASKADRAPRHRGGLRRYNFNNSAHRQEVAAEFESAGKLPPFTEHGTDVAQPGALERVASQIAFKGEVILICGDGSAAASPMALNTVLQMYAMRLQHVLYVSDSPASCAKLNLAVGGQLACVWSSRIIKSKPVNDGGCTKKYWDMRFYFYDIRKDIVARLAVDLGINVLQTDTDVAWFENPYPLLKMGRSASINLISQWDAPYVNAGVFYIQNVNPADGAAWVLRELYRRIHLFMFTPSAVAQVRSAAAWVGLSWAWVGLGLGLGLGRAGWEGWRVGMGWDGLMLDMVPGLVGRGRGGVV